MSIISQLTIIFWLILFLERDFQSATDPPEQSRELLVSKTLQQYHTTFYFYISHPSVY